MNVLVVDQFGEIGGAQKCLLDLLAAWPDDGTVVVASPEGALSDAVRTLGFRTVVIPCGPYGLGRKSVGDALRFVRETLAQRAILRRVIEQHSIDTIYVNGPRVLAGTVDSRCRVIFHAHNYLSHWYDRAVLRFARPQTTIACCRYVGQALSLRRPLRPPGLVIPNGVPDAGFHLHTHTTWKIGIVGRISPEKGHLALLRALRGLPVSLIIAGSAQYTPADYEAEVRREAAGMDVRFTGWMNDVGSLLKELDLLAVPSIAEPGLPRVVLEAFSAGVPVLAAPTGGIPDAVLDNVTGFLAGSATPEAIRTRLQVVMSMPPDGLTAVALRARFEWERYWNVDRWRSEVLSVIRGAHAAPAEALQQGREQCGRVMSEA